jgi:hypothetical protein
MQNRRLTETGVFRKPLFLICFLLFLAFCFSLFPSHGIAEVLDCIVAVVNNRVITLADLKFMDSFGLYNEEMSLQAGDRLASILERVIDQKVVLDLIPGQSGVTDQEMDEAIWGLTQKLGAENIQNKLSQFGAGMETLRTYLEEKLLCQKIISQRFGQEAVISLNEIETYYRESYVPGQKKLGLEPEPMVQILGQIETLIKKEKTEQQIKAWIKNLRLQAEILIKRDCLKED